MRLLWLCVVVAVRLLWQCSWCGGAVAEKQAYGDGVAVSPLARYRTRAAFFPKFLRVRGPPRADRHECETRTRKKWFSGHRNALLGLKQFVIAISNRDLGDVRDLRDGGLGGLLVGQKGGGVDRGGGQSDG